MKIIFLWVAVLIKKSLRRINWDIKNCWFNQKCRGVPNEYILRTIDETRSYLNQEIKQNELMIKKHKKICTTWDYLEHLLILAFVVTVCVLISAFASTALKKEFSS